MSASTSVPADFADRVPAIIVPVSPRELGDVPGELEGAKGAHWIEWRIDALEAMELEERLKVGRAIRAGTALPVLATFRSVAQGGARDIDALEYVELLLAIASNRIADAVDVEMFSGTEWEATHETPTRQGEASPACVHAETPGGLARHGESWSGPVPTIDQLLVMLGEMRCTVVGSWHDFSSTPSSKEIEERLVAMARHGADFAKIAVTTRSPADLEALRDGANAARERRVERIIAIGMGEAGADSRIHPENYASCATFVAGASASAPGQLTIPQLNAARMNR
ncbi:type I 3-dehydroquinate dehydratase [Arcanobacterium wilhelmae]|uniref:type I 3-dehydroquinate dehydratase n=1 Tax=Arcanobacterium wilhelmae TaxID=1803177 RepID=UPI00241519E5|nr:type I 3-dehydroquinate dehydratase [Arcanobacterium wilhelmae]WFN89860.1 type I 3-dehydroquinate dehydratase [Arcanobacterium wilhelmae]